MKAKVGIKGRVCAQVFGPDGKLKKRKFSFSTVLKVIRGWLTQKYISFEEMIKMIKYEYCINHNIVTNEGDALIADLLQESPERTKLDNSNAVIGVGTGYSAENKTVDALVTQTGSDEAMDATYPKTEGNWAAANDNVIQYRSTFEAGDLNDTGIDEALLGNGTDTMAYAEITVPVNVTTADTLQVDWELTILGS